VERRTKYGILSIFGVFCEYINLEYVHIHVTYRVQQVEYAIRIHMAAPHEYVNTYPTRRLGVLVLNPFALLQVKGRNRQGCPVFFDGDIDLLKGKLVPVRIIEVRSHSEHAYIYIHK